jgi:predicted dehydrogenase
MAETTWGVLVHGAGWVSTQHLAAFKGNPRAKVLAVSSRKLESARKRADEAGLRDAAAYDSLEKALAHPGVDIVSICSPQHVHAGHVVAAARAGKHLVIEKPVGISLDELRKMRDAVRAARVRTVVSFVLRWNPLFRNLKAMISRGAIGRPYYVEADYFSHIGSWWSGWEDTRTRAQGVSAFLVAGCHAADALRWFAAPGEFEAAEPVEVFALAGGYRKGTRREYLSSSHTWREDAPVMEYDGLEVALVKFSNGALGKVSVNFDCVSPYQFPVRVFGDRGTILDHRLWSHEVAGQKEWREVEGIRPDSADVAHHPFQAEIDHFLECLDGNHESFCNLEDAIRTHEMAFAALRSYETRRPVELPLA